MNCDLSDFGKYLNSDNGQRLAQKLVMCKHREILKLQMLSFYIMDGKCEKENYYKDGNYSSKIGYFCLEHILDYDMVCPNDDCPRKGHVMDKLISEIKKDLNGDMHQIFLCPSCNYRHDHKVNV